MCDECWSIAREAASAAYSRLGDALTYFNTESGQKELPDYRVIVGASQGAVAGVHLRTQREPPRQATAADVDALEKARDAFALMSTTNAGQVKPYRDFSGDQLDLDRAIRQIRELWSKEPEQHNAR